MAELALAGVTLAYVQSGAGDDIVWLAPGDSPGANWRRYQTPAFDDAYRSTTYDARGVGATACDDPPPWSIVDHAQDLAALITAVCGAPVFLVGLSMGSLIAVQLAHDRPELVRSAVVMGTCVRKTGFIREWEVDYDSSAILPRIAAPFTQSRSRRMCKRRPSESAKSRSSPATDTFTCSRDWVTDPPSATAPRLSMLASVRSSMGNRSAYIRSRSPAVAASQIRRRWLPSPRGDR